MKMNNKGYASTIIMFSVLALFLVSMLMLIQTMNNSKSLNKNITDKVTDNIDYSASGTIQSQIDELNNTITTMKNEMTNMRNQLSDDEKNRLDKTYPIGSIYMTTTYTNADQVHDAIGGIWEKYAQGRTIIGEGTGTDSNGLVQTFTNGTSGGEYKHKLTVAEMPSHEHNVYSPTGHTWASGFNYSNNQSGKAGVNFVVTPDYVNNGQYYGGRPMYAAATGGNGSHNNVEPYIVTYIYKRIK